MIFSESLLPFQIALLILVSANYLELSLPYKIIYKSTKTLFVDNRNREEYFSSLSYRIQLIANVSTTDRSFVCLNQCLDALLASRGIFSNSTVLNDKFTLFLNSFSEQ